MNLLLRSLCIFLALVSCQASRRWSSSINTLDFVDGSNAVINAYIYKKERSSDLYPAKIKRVYKGCNLEQYETILIDVGHPSNKKCDVDLRSGQRYLLFGHVMDSVAAAYDQRSSAGQKVFVLTECAPAPRIDRLSRNERQSLRTIPKSSCGVHIPDDRTAYGHGVCSRGDCGRLPYDTSPIYCADGSTAGFTNQCIRSNSGRCEWEITECPKCDYDSDCPGSHICERNECVPAECHVHADCGSYEHCTDGRCVRCDCGEPNQPFLCHDGYSYGGEAVECTLDSYGGGCSWTYSKCPDCSVDSDCVAIENGICREGTCEKGECSEHSHCGNHEVCEYGHCVPCQCRNTRTEYLCDDGKTYGDRPDFCTRKYGRCEYVYTECAPCYSNADCGGLDFGICKNGQCEEGECYDSGDCGITEVCEHGVCKPCECHVDQEPYRCHDYSNFGGEPYDCKRQDYGQCAYSYTECSDCQYDEDCKGLGDKGVCKNGQCSLAQCFDDHHCADDEICVNHHCVPCDCGHPSPSFMCHDRKSYGGEPLDCKRRNNGQCAWTYSSCEDCYSNQDCHALDNGVCKNGECVEAQCLSDHDCADDEVCENHHCVPCDCGHPSPSFMCHDRKSYGGEPIDCKRRNNGQCAWTYSSCEDCYSNQDCHALDNGVCKNGECVEAQCLSDHDCADDEVCENHHCVPCDCGYPSPSFMCHDRKSYGGEPIDCKRRNNGQCAWTYSTCSECYSNQDCNALDNGVCKNGECVEAQCLNDHECAHDEVCENHHCVRCDCGQPSKTPFLCHNGVDYGDQPLRGGCKKDSNSGVCAWHYSTCPACHDDLDCSALDYGRCIDGECQSAECYDGYNCGESQYCDYGFCVECDCGQADGRSRCSDGVSFSGPDKCVYKDGQCQWTYKECPICGRDYQCQHGYECHNGECVPAAVCDTNNDCERDEFCNYSGKCVKCDCGDHYGNDDKHECKDGLTIGGYTGACIHAADQCEWEYISCPRCTSDYDCGGGLYCVEGFCSATRPYNSVCHSDTDCGYDHYCASGQCLAMGSCQNRNDCYNPSNNFHYNVNCHVPRLDCSYGQCQASCCRRPNNCFVAPCDQQSCRDGDLASCANDYCNGCKARFFTYDGSPTCLGY